MLLSLMLSGVLQDSQSPLPHSSMSSNQMDLL